MSKKMIVLKSSDGKFFEIDETIALQSETIAQQVKDDSASKEISLPNVTSTILEIVIEYCKKHVVGVSEEDLKDWDADFMKKFTDDRSTLFDMAEAAYHLSIKNLVDLTCQAIADMLNHKTEEQMREFFGIGNDFTPEEEEELRRENAWAFE